MNKLPLLRLALASLRNRSAIALLTLTTLALSTMLLVGVGKVSQSLKTGFEATLTDTDLIVGARTAPVNLLLASVFRIGDAPANISAQTVQALSEHPEIAWTVPISLGDNHRGFRVLGTNATYYQHYRYGRSRALTIAQGKLPKHEEDVVLGAEVAEALGYEIGSELELTHGLGEAGISDHGDHPFTVSGILAPTGTPVDQTVHVDLEAISEIHGGGQAAMSVSALLVGLENRTSILRTKHIIDTWPDEALLAVLPGQALGELWSITGLAERALFGISGLLVLVGFICVLTSLLTSLAVRRRELAVLRAVGARPWQIGGLLVIETVCIGFAGAVLGVLLVQLGLVFGGGVLEARWGIRLQETGLGLVDVAAVAAMTLGSAAIGLIPAIIAYRRTLMDGLNVRL